MENAEDQLTDIETQLRALAAVDATPRAEDAALLERLMAKADAAAAAAAPAPWYRRAALWRKVAVCVPLALVAGISALAVLHYLPLQDARSALRKQELPEPTVAPTVAPAMHLPRSQEDMRLPQGSLAEVSDAPAHDVAGTALAQNAPVMPARALPVTVVSQPESTPCRGAEDAEELPGSPSAMAVSTCADLEEDDHEEDVLEPTAAAGSTEPPEQAQHTVATYGSGSEANTTRTRASKRSAKRAKPVHGNIGTRLRGLIRHWQHEFSATLRRLHP